MLSPLFAFSVAGTVAVVVADTVADTDCAIVALHASSPVETAEHRLGLCTVW